MKTKTTRSITIFFLFLKRKKVSDFHLEQTLRGMDARNHKKSLVTLLNGKVANISLLYI